MSRTMLNPSIQMTSSVVYAATGAAGATLQTGAVTVEDDLNAIRSQISRALDATLSGNWYDDVYTTATSKKRSIKQLNTSLDTLETKTLLARVSNAASVPVPSGQNYVVLSNSGGLTPSTNMAVALTTLGAVCAQSTNSAAAFAANELTVIAGNVSQQPRNLLSIRDATTEQVIESGGYDVFGLLQVESTAVDGSAFNDTSGGNRAKISFVIMNPSTGGLSAAAASDIAGHSIQYSYVLRSTLALMPEQNFLGSGVFVDSIADTNINLTRSVMQQSGAPVPVPTDVLWRVANSVNFKVQNASGSTDLFGISPTSTGNAAYFNTDTLSINTTTPVMSTKGFSVATGGQAINVGVATGTISTVGPLTLQNTGGSALAEISSGLITFADGNLSAAGWSSSALSISSTTADWTAYKTAFGEASLLNGIVQAAQKASHTIKWAAVTAALVPAGTNLTGAGASANLDAQLLNYANMTNYTTQVKVFINGTLIRPGASLTDTSQDWYPGTSVSTGDIKLTFPVRGIAGHQDLISMEVSGNPLDAA